MSGAILPIDKIIPQLLNSLRSQNRLILQAPPGAGKTTRVPLALLGQDWLGDKSILMLEPRRLAASNAAGFMAAQLGEPVGSTVGFTIRYQRKTSSKTRIEIVTEGVLTRRMQQNPDLPGVGLVIFDEFHERHLQSDLALALCCDIQQGLREDLRLLVMSATLDAEPLARLLDAPILTSTGRCYPVDIHYLAVQQQNDQQKAMQAGIRRAVKDTSGDLLAFLPGEGEIHRCQEQLEDLAEHLDIRPLYGNLNFADQERAILPGPRRKLVLATNIAETSLTIEGIRVVIDSGLCRRPRFDAGTGLTRLELCQISQASAAQRAGRAGRLGPGHCFRLWSENTQGALLPFSPAEIRSADLTALALELLNWGANRPNDLAWLDPPPEAAWQSARMVLQTLGCLTQQGRLTELGKQISAFPIHPRLGCLLSAAKTLGSLRLGCDLVALLTEPDPWQNQPPGRHRSRSDLGDRLEAYWARRQTGRLQEFHGVDRAARYWGNFFNLAPGDGKPDSVDHELLARLLLSAYPDRFGKRRPNSANRYVLSSGQGAQLSDRSALQQEEFLIALDLRGGSVSEPQINIGSAVDKKDLSLLFPSLPWDKEVCWNEEQERVVSRAKQKIGHLVLAEKSLPGDFLEIQPVLLEVLRKNGLGLLNPGREAETFIARNLFLQRTFPEENWPDFSANGLLESLEDWLLPFLGAARCRSDLQKIDLIGALRSRLDWNRLKKLDRFAPERFQVPSGSQIRLHYSTEKVPPVLAVKLQEMFGLSVTPRIADGRCALLIHLLSPAGRPLQITQDLVHFWAHSYPEVQKEMKGRYPKHPWPDNPQAALPTAKTKLK